MEDSDTLRVDIVIYVDDTSIDARKDAATTGVLVSVTVHEPETGIAILDAAVTGGPAGRPIALALQNGPHISGSFYGGYFTGYERAWEFSIVRGSDHLRRVILVGPSYPSLTVARDETSGLVVAWSPAREANVVTSVCAFGAPTFQDLGRETRCADPEGRHDEGSVVLAPPFLPATWIEFIASVTDVPVGSRGGVATFQLQLYAVAPASP